MTSRQLPLRYLAVAAGMTIALFSAATSAAQQDLISESIGPNSLVSGASSETDALTFMQPRRQLLQSCPASGMCLLLQHTACKLQCTACLPVSHTSTIQVDARLVAFPELSAFPMTLTQGFAVVSFSHNYA